MDIPKCELRQKLQNEIAKNKQLEKKILQISDYEKLRIGRDLHDTLGQCLSGIQLTSEALHRHLAAKKSSAISCLEQMIKLIEQSIDQIRSISRGLFLLHLQGSNVISAIEEIAKCMVDMGLKCHVDCDSQIEVYDLDKITHIYRIVQEATTNAIKHGKAKNIWLTLYQQQQQIILEIENDGNCFVKKEKSDGMGLFTIRLRTELFAGSCEIEAREQGGTKVICFFPIDSLS